MLRPTIRTYDSLFLWPSDQYERIKDKNNLTPQEKTVKFLLKVFAVTGKVTGMQIFFRVLHYYLKQIEMGLLGNPNNIGGGVYIRAKVLKKHN